MYFLPCFKLRIALESPTLAMYAASLNTRTTKAQLPLISDPDTDSRIARSVKCLSTAFIPWYNAVAGSCGKCELFTTKSASHELRNFAQLEPPCPSKTPKILHLCTTSPPMFRRSKVLSSLYSFITPLCVVTPYPLTGPKEEMLTLVE